MKKLKLLPSILMLTACVAILGVGVFAVAPTQNSISGSITINASNPEVLISAYKYDAEGNMESTPFMDETPVRSGIDIDLDALTFDTSKANSEEDLEDLDIKVTIRISNPSSTKLGVYFSKTAVAGAATSGDVATEKPLTDSTTANTNVKAVMDGYKPLDAKGANNGVCDTTITFKLLTFMSSDASVDLTNSANQIYLNIETYNEDLIPKDDAYYQSLGYVVTDDLVTLYDDIVADINNCVVKVKIAEGTDLETFADGMDDRIIIDELVLPTTLKTLSQTGTNIKAKKVIIPRGGVETIASNSLYSAFDQNTITSIVVPNTVTNIEWGASYYIFGLKWYVEVETKPATWNEYWNVCYDDPITDDEGEVIDTSYSYCDIEWGYECSTENSDAYYQSLGFEIFNKAPEFDQIINQKFSRVKVPEGADLATFASNLPYNFVISELVLPTTLKTLTATSNLQIKAAKIIIPKGGAETIKSRSFEKLFDKEYAEIIVIPDTVTTIEIEACYEFYNSNGGIKCCVEVEEKPETWHADWNGIFTEEGGYWYAPVEWGYEYNY